MWEICRFHEFVTPTPPYFEMRIMDAHRNFHQKYSITTNGNDDGQLEKSGQQIDGTPSKSILQTSMQDCQL